MTREEKEVLMSFLDITDDYLRDGHQRERTDYSAIIEDDETSGEKSGLPLAYTVDEPEGTYSTDGDVEAPALIENAASFPEEEAAKIRACQSCELGSAGSKTISGIGSLKPLVMIIGPGLDTKETEAGKLLDKMLLSIGLSREENCYITNVIKCRLPVNRDPSPEEIAACLPFLEHEIGHLKPRIILCAGKAASNAILKNDRSLDSLRGNFFEYKLSTATDAAIIPVLCTYHPNDILTDEAQKRPAWEDLKLLKAKIISLTA